MSALPMGHRPMTRVSIGMVVVVNVAEMPRHIEHGTDVRMLIDDRLYDLTATLVTDAAEFAAFSDAYAARVGLCPRTERVDAVYLFRLTARSP